MVFSVYVVVLEGLTPPFSRAFCKACNRPCQHDVSFNPKAKAAEKRRMTIGDHLRRTDEGVDLVVEREAEGKVIVLGRETLDARRDRAGAMLCCKRGVRREKRREERGGDKHHSWLQRLVEVGPSKSYQSESICWWMSLSAVSLNCWLVQEQG